MTLYFKLSNEQLKALHCPADTYFAVFGVPPDMETFSSTHLYEIPYADVKLKLARLSGQELFVQDCIKMWGEKRVKELLDYKPVDDVE
jgi:hypothetical protein